METGGAEEDRTPDLMIANHSLSQLSYSPEILLYNKKLFFPVKQNKNNQLILFYYYCKKGLEI